MHRRQLLKNTVTCGAHLLALSAAPSHLAHTLFQSQDADNVVAKEKWAKIEKMHDGVFAVISTPFESKDFTTVCNGGIIVGTKGTLVVEAFMQPKGAKWVSEQAQKLGGKQPTDVVVTHYHADHSGGHPGFGTGNTIPKLWLTSDTMTRAKKNPAPPQAEKPEFREVQQIDAAQPTVIDLGNRKVTLTPRSGHTSSDVTIEVSDPRIVFCGDLFFNRMFPNYADATPSALKAFVSTMSKEKDVTYVPGHGPIAHRDDLKFYGEFLDYVETQAKDAFAAGKTVEAASKEFKLPDNLASWLIWSPAVVGRAYAAWYRELGQH